MIQKSAIVFYNMPPGVNLDFLGRFTGEEFRLTDDREEIDNATAIIFFMPTLSPDDEILQKKTDGPLWVFWSNESEAGQAWQYEPKITALFDISATCRLDSDVPIPYIHPNLYGELRREPLNKTGFVAAFISGTANQSGRRQYLEELMSYIGVDSYGKVLHNCTLAEDTGFTTKQDILSRYRFTLAFENAISRDYVTDMLYDPLVAGSVPVYLGAPNVEEFVPGDHCYINAASFPSVKALADHLMGLRDDEDRYGEYLRWKTRPFRLSFNTKAKYGAKNPIWNLCQVIRRKKHQSTTV
jgi:hypothetical protein